MKKLIVTHAQGTHPIKGSQAQGMLVQNRIFPELHFAEHGVKPTVVGPEQVDGRNTYKLSHTTADGSYTWSTNYDAETGLKVQQTRPTPAGIIETLRFDDYREINGVKYALKISSKTHNYQFPNYHYEQASTY
ncbi:hypothetical protein GCM10023189_56110 [Nibrella saemangeumensis]|uniref:Uncharacterized protein n=1 Tax=Nibrella saemangeumensis TaxID=1084526 RepID=A0ABP8NQR5_9BACT